MRFQDAVRDGRAVVYAGIQADPLVARAASLLEGATDAERLLARAAMTGERLDPETWHRIFPTLFGEGVGEELRRHAEDVLGVSLEIADLGDASRSQYRGALVEELTARLLELPERLANRVLQRIVGGVLWPVEPARRRPSGGSGACSSTAFAPRSIRTT